MKKRYPAAVAILTGALLLFGPTVANAASEDDIPYCAPSTGCYVDPDTGEEKYAEGPQLTDREQRLAVECNLRTAGSLLGGAGGVLTKSWLAIAGAVFNGASAGVGPCQELWDSTKRFR